MDIALTPAEARVLACITEAAENGRRFPTGDDLMEALGCEALSTTVQMVKNLERKGFIKVERFQRDREGTIVKTDQKTAPAKSRISPWRKTGDNIRMPGPLRTLQVQDNGFFREILLMAKRENKSSRKLLVELVREAMAARSIQSVVVEG